MPENTYWRNWSREYRGLLILLLDQSGSMRNQIQIDNKIYTNGQMATGILNNMLATTIENTPQDDDRQGIKDYCDILVLGYGDKVVELLSNGARPISIRELPSRATDRKKIQLELFDKQAGRFIVTTKEQYTWIDTVESSNRTEMFLALKRTYDEVDLWLNADKQRAWSHPPIIINITDGQHYGVGEPLDMARQLCQLYTNDGHVLLFNCHLTSHGNQRLVFPTKEQQIDAVIADPMEREWAKRLFQMSSSIPQPMINKAQTRFKAKLEAGCRGFIYNANPIDLIEFLRWGTMA